MKSKNNWVSLLLDNNGFIVVNKAIVKILGLDCSVLLGELISEYNYYEKIGQLTDKTWFYSTTPNIEEQTGLFRKTIEKGLNKLKNEELIDIRIIGMPRKRYIEINFKNIEKLINNSIKDSSSRDKYPYKQGQKSVPVGTKIPTSKDKKTYKKGQKSVPVRTKIPTSKDKNTYQQGEKSLQVGTKDTLNNNNITIINNNNNKQSIISGNDGLVTKNEYAQFVDKINLKELLKQYKENTTDRANLENILKIIQNLFKQQKNKIIDVGKNEEVTLDYFKDYLLKNYSFETIEYILESYKNNTTRIKNIKKYIITMLYNAPQTIDLYYNNTVKNDKQNISERPNDYYENLFLAKSAQGAYRGAQ